MARACFFAWPNYTDPTTAYVPTFSGGSWSASLPLTNLADRRLAKVARSTDATLVNTQFDLDLGAPRGIQVFAIPKHTISTAGLIRIRGSSTAGVFTSPVYDTGWIDVFPVIYPFGTLPWGHPSFWTGKISAEDAALYNVAFIHLAPSIKIARYWRFEIDDTTNTAGYIDLSRLFVSTGYQPTINMSYGAKLGVETATIRTESDGGATVFNEKARRRNCTFVLDYIPEDEAMVNAFEMQRRLGISGQLFFIFDPDDTVHMHRRAFLSVFRDLSPLEFPYLARTSTPFSLVEEL